MGCESKAYAALEPCTELVPYKYRVLDCGVNDVRIKVLYCGICHSDIHQVKNEWTPGIFPMVPGHEIIGIVEELGDKVTKFKIGDCVGIGCMVDCCRNCTACQEGNEQCCHKVSFTYNGVYQNGENTYGGYGTYVTANEDFLLSIPENLNRASAAPLLCAGITVFSPLVKYNMNRPGFKLAVIGLGGLGHMALKFGVSFGCEVTVITRSESKREDSIRMGAKNFINIQDKEVMKKYKGYFNGIIDTVCSKRNAEELLDLLSHHGVLACVGAPPTVEKTEISSFSLIIGEKMIAGSSIGNIKTTQQMLDYCSKNNITASIELIKITEVNKAFERMLKSDVRYRFVIDVANSQDLI